MREINKVLPNYFGPMEFRESDRVAVENVYIDVVRTPFKDNYGNDVVRNSDELALFCRFYSANLNAETMANFVKSLQQNQVNIPSEQIPSAFEFVRSRYCQSPSELQAYYESLDSSAVELENNAKDEYSAFVEKQRLDKEKRENEKNKDEPEYE